MDNVLKVKSKNSVLIYNGIPNVEISETTEEIRESFGLTTDDFVILFVGRLRIQKSVDTLIEAISLIHKKIISPKVLLVGEGPEYSYLNEKVNKLGLEKVVRFEGTTLSPERYFKIANIFVLPSVFEGLGLVILEAFRAQIPVIASRIEGPEELIVDKENGCLFEPKNFEELASLMLKLYEHPEKSRVIAANGNRAFNEEFNISKYADSLNLLYSN